MTRYAEIGFSVEGNVIHENTTSEVYTEQGKVEASGGSLCKELK